MKRRIKKILLMTPRYTLYKQDIRRCVSSLGLACLGAFLERHEYKVRILDVAAEGYYNVQEQGDFVTYGLSEEEIREEIIKFAPDIVGISCIFTTQSKNAKDLARIVKDIDGNIITSIGGSHPTYTVEKILDNEHIDYVVMGEGELPTLQLCEALNNGGDISKIGGIAYKEKNNKFINDKLQYVENVDELPFPARHLLNMERYFQINVPQNPYCLGERVAQIVTSRGCTARCTFCTTTNFWGNRYRGRSSESVIAEIKEVKKNMV